jgi:hypothetical protein
MLGGLQAAASLAGAAAQSRDLRRQARYEADAARADAALASARAEFARDDAERGSSAERARVFSSGADPGSPSVVSTLAASHAARLDPALALGADAARSLHQGEVRSRLLRAQGRQHLTRSLLGAALNALQSGQSGDGFRIPG